MSQPARTHDEIEAQILEIQEKARANASNGAANDSAGVSLAGGLGMDSAIYGAADKFADYVTSIAANDDDDEEDEDGGIMTSNGKRSVNAPAALLRDVVDDVSYIIFLWKLN